MTKAQQIQAVCAAVIMNVMQDRIVKAAYFANSKENGGTGVSDQKSISIVTLEMAEKVEGYSPELEAILPMIFALVPNMGAQVKKSIFQQAKDAALTSKKPKAFSLTS